MTECPNAPTLLAFAFGQADEGDALGIAAHVEECPECAGFVADVSTFPDDIEPREGTTPPSEEQTAVDRDALRLAAGHHLTPKLLAAYCDGSLTTTSEDLVMDHLALCKTCARSMVDLTDRFNPEASWADFVERHGAEFGFGGEGDGEAGRPPRRRA